MTNQEAEAIERLENLKVKAEIALNNSNTSCEWLKEDVKGTIIAFTMAIEALEKQMHNCEDCRRAYSVPSNPIIYCFEHDCIMRGDNCCRDWSEED